MKHKKYCTNEVESIYEMGWKAHMVEDWDKAAYYYKLAAKCGNIAAMESLGKFYIYGLGVKVNHEKGLMWLEKAALRGSSDACSALGDYYFIGYDVGRNALLAKKWWKKAIDRGNTRAAKAYNYYFGIE